MYYCKLTDDLAKITCALELSRQIVGIKFIFTREDFAAAEAKELTGKIAYCVMVASATRGHAIKAAAENFGCFGGARALGIVELDENYTSARHFDSLGLYQDLATAKNVINNLTCCQHKAYGVMIKPLSEFRQEPPDVVIIVANAYNAMRIVQGYTYIYGTNTAFKLTGNQAICSECTAYPFESNNINISALCAGTRFKARWKDDELSLGLPFNKFSGLAGGTYATINATDPNEKKSLVEAKLKEKKRTDLLIEYDRNYFTGLYEKDAVHFPDELR
jgi:uncharacterized protein (DUF169 family)